jgi:hypothetical protein
MPAPRRPRPFVAGAPITRFTRGRVAPRGVTWFGLGSFWGHMRHLVASAIATEDVDSRDWMTPDDPQELVRLAARALGADASKATLVEALGRDVWIDYVADTGDDVSVSRAVARLVFAEHELPDPDRPGEALVAPRGDVLLFGGDTAYPVATAHEIAARVVRPWNEVLEAAPDPRPRVLLGVAGNHDWYDGLDGFGRMFRRRDDDAAPARVPKRARQLAHAAEFARALFEGKKVDKPRGLALRGYRAVQNASYFALPVAPAFHLLALDRQLRTIDRRQQRFFRDHLAKHPGVAPWIALPDPVHAFGRPSPTGVGMLRSLGLADSPRPLFALSGDVHHYERLREGARLHVTAGGGGAFLHPAPLSREGRLPCDVEFPDARQSRRLLAGVAWKIALGRSGFLPHLGAIALFLPSFGVGLRVFERSGVFVPAPAISAVVITIAYLLLGDVRHRGHRVVVPALVAGAITAAIPALAALGLEHLVARGHAGDALPWVVPATMLVAAFASAYVFGLYLAALTWLGVEEQQAFTALDHPGFKHVVRLRVRADGRGIDGWCVGVVDPLGEGEHAEAVLVDAFTWRPRASEGEGEGEGEGKPAERRA